MLHKHRHSRCIQIQVYIPACIIYVCVYSHAQAPAVESLVYMVWGGVQTSILFKTVVPQIEVLEMPVPESHSRHSGLIGLGSGLGIRIFFKAPRVILMCSQGCDPLG